MAPTQRQATTPRRRTPSRAAKAGGALQRAASGTGSLSPPPPLPRPAVSSIPLDPVKDWLEKEQATDPVFSSKQQIAVVNQSIGGHGIQPYDHAAPILFPNVARMFGLRRWKHRRIPPNKSRGPSCVVVGHAKVVKCHISCIPAFLYKLPGKECPQARKRHFPTLIFNWHITKEGDLLANSCWSCFTSGDSDCPVKDTRLSVLSSPPSIEDNELAASSGRGQSPDDSTGSPSAPRVDGKIDQASPDPGDDDNVLFAPKKPSHLRSASQAELDPQPFRRYLLNASTNPQVDRAPDLFRPAESLAQRESGDGKRVLSDSHLQPSPMIHPNKRRAVSEGAQEDWRTVLANELQRPPSASPDGRGTNSSSHETSHGPPGIVLYPPLSHDRSTVGLLAPQTPSPQPRSGSKAPSTPKHLVAINDINSGLLALRQQFSQAVASTREAFEAADRAEKTVILAIEKTQSACGTLKAAAESEQQSIDALRLDRDKNASQVGVLKVRVADNMKEIKQKSAKIDELNKQLEFLQNTLNAEKVRQASFDSVIADAVNAARKSQEESAQLSQEVGRLQEANRQSQSRLREVAARQITLSRALADAGKENDHLVQQVHTLRSALGGFAGDKTADDILASLSGPTGSVSDALPAASDGSTPLPQEPQSTQPTELNSGTHPQGTAQPQAGPSDSSLPEPAAAKKDETPSGKVDESHHTPSLPGALPNADGA